MPFEACLQTKGRNCPMKKMKYLRTWLVVALVVTIIGSLTGGTVAWFTDSVESTGNEIKSGILDIKLYAGKASANLTEVTDGSPALFNYNLWEPGYTEVRYLKIENAGNLALKYQFGINPSSITTGANDTANLAEVIDMYVFDPSSAITREAIAAATPVGTLETLKGEGEVAFSGYLLPAEGEGSDDYNTDVTTPRGSVEKVIVLKMQESAGNEYQNCSLSNVGIKLEAAQYTWENDSFDHMYDEDADFVSSNLPTAKVTQPDTNMVVDIYDLTSFQTTGETKTLDATYIFETTETYEEAMTSPYSKWHADFVVSFDKDVAAESVGLGGDYGIFNNIGFTTPIDVDAADEIRLMEAFRVINYEELCKDVQKFTCGVFNLSDSNVGTTMTVELRLYETEEPSESNGNSVNVETGKYVTIASYNYTLEAPQDVNIDSDLPKAEINPTDNITVDMYDVMNGFSALNKTEELDVTYIFKATDTHEEALANPYADWIADYVVSFDKDVVEGSLGLGGQYAGFNVGFYAPMNIEAGTEIPLLTSVGGVFTYADLCEQVKEFTCGAFNVSAVDTTMTVELRLTNPIDADDYKIIASFTHTF